MKEGRLFLWYIDPIRDRDTEMDRGKDKELNIATLKAVTNNASFNSKQC